MIPLRLVVGHKRSPVFFKTCWMGLFFKRGDPASVSRISARRFPRPFPASIGSRWRRVRYRSTFRLVREQSERQRPPSTGKKRWQREKTRKRKSLSAADGGEGEPWRWSGSARCQVVKIRRLPFHLQAAK